MLTVSANLKNAITGKGQQLVRIYDSLRRVILTNSDIVQGTFYVDKRCVSGSTFSFGNAIANELHFSIFNTDISGWFIEGLKVFVEIGAYINGVAQYFTIGDFYLDKPVYTADVITFTGYDGLTKLDDLAENRVMLIDGGINVLGTAIPAFFSVNENGFADRVLYTSSSPFYTASITSYSPGLLKMDEGKKWPKTIDFSCGTLGTPSGSMFIYAIENGSWTCLGYYILSDNTYFTFASVSYRYRLTFTWQDSTQTKLEHDLYELGHPGPFYLGFSLTIPTGLSATPVIAYNSATPGTRTIQEATNDVCSEYSFDFLFSVDSQNIYLPYEGLADYSKYSYRTILSMFAAACGANIIMRPAAEYRYEGQLKYAIPSSTGITLDESNVMSSDIDNEAVLINGTRYVTSDGTLYINRTDNTTPYRFFDFSSFWLFPIDRQSGVDNLAVFTGSSQTWLPGKAKILAMPWLEPMDVVEFDYNIKPYRSGRFVITRVIITANGVTQIESAGFPVTTTNSNGYTPSPSVPSQDEPEFKLVYSSESTSHTAGTTSQVMLSTFPYNLPSPNDYIINAAKNLGIVTALNGTYVTVKWLVA